MTPEQRMEFLVLVAGYENAYHRMEWMGRIVEFVEKLEREAFIEGQDSILISDPEWGKDTY